MVKIYFHFHHKNQVILFHAAGTSRGKSGLIVGNRPHQPPAIIYQNSLTHSIPKTSYFMRRVRQEANPG